MEEIGRGKRTVIGIKLIIAIFGRKTQQIANLI